LNTGTHLYRVIISGDFDVPMYDWLNCTLLSNCYYCNKIKGNLINATSCFLGLNRHNNSIPNSALPDLVSTNINDLRVSTSNDPMVVSNNCHPPLNLDFKLTFDCQLTFLTHRHNYGQGGDYLKINNTLSNCNW
jgi:hypothetical protein